MRLDELKRWSAEVVLAWIEMAASVAHEWWPAASHVEGLNEGGADAPCHRLGRR